MLQQKGDKERCRNPDCRGHQKGDGRLRAIIVQVTRNDEGEVYFLLHCADCGVPYWVKKP